MNLIGNILYPEQFITNKIYTHPKFEQELKDMLEQSGFKQQFIRLYRQRLKFLEERGQNCIQKTDWFEALKNSNGLYSMKFKSIKNVRIIFTFTDFNKNNISILLCSFEEKNSKSNSKNSYNKAIQIACERMKELQII